jgi:hypothetical protein
MTQRHHSLRSLRMSTMGSEYTIAVLGSCSVYSVAVDATVALVAVFAEFLH